MAQPTIVFDGVWKKFRRGERHSSLRDLIPSLVKRAGRRRGAADLADAEEFWALRDVSFDVRPGEALGIIGPNGAGKSTTLKLLTKILKPTRGHALVRGRVGSLIEIAAGFHPDLTGRENIFLQGAIMGMKRPEIARKLDEIIEFAGVSDFIDTPVKRYSSGMNARLGFAIAANLEPDALIIDEVLSVGDMAFQARCMERMKTFKRSGVAIAFVSHNLQAIAELCDSAVLLGRGERVAGGPAADVIRSYVRHTQAAGERAGSCVDIHGELVGAGQEGSVRPGDGMLLSIHGVSHAAFSDVTVGLVLHRATDNLVVYDGNFSADELNLILEPEQPFQIDFQFTAHLTRGQYYLSVHLYHNPTSRFLCHLAPAALFGVMETRTYAGVADLDVRPSVITDLVGAVSQ
jgi:lipopolysaccharide transport system ATP-binding protein